MLPGIQMAASPGFMMSILPGVFIGATSLITSQQVISWPAGTQAGDLAIMLAVDNYSWTVPGWTVVKSFSLDIASGTSGHAVYSKIVTSGDLSSPPTLPTSGLVFGQWHVLVYRNIASAAVLTAATGSGADVSVGVLSPSGAAKMLLALGIDRDPSTPGYVSGWSGRASGTGTYFGQALSDIQRSSYGGGSVSIPLISGSYVGIGEVIELR